MPTKGIVGNCLLQHFSENKLENRNVRSNVCIICFQVLNSVTIKFIENMLYCKPKHCLTVATGIQALQEREELGDYGPDISIICDHRASNNVHSNGVAMHTR